jgi:hypothetical protein
MWAFFNQKEQFILKLNWHIRTFGQMKDKLCKDLPRSASIRIVMHLERMHIMLRSYKSCVFFLAGVYDMVGLSGGAGLVDWQVEVVADFVEG